MAAVLITGMSGTGKSTLLAELAARGHRVVDTDEGGWIEPTRLEGGTTEPMWDERRIARLLDGSEGSTVFVAGCVANQGRFYHRFDAVVLLSAPEAVILKRIAARTTNDFGKSADERVRILSDLREIEPLLRAGATAEIDTRSPVSEVADQLERIAAAHAA
jgi:dephospho-CoA kinase